mgnify:CR=1 FL=1
MRAIDVVRKLAPQARSAYVQAFEEGDALLARYEVAAPLRLAHFLAQVMHETGGLTVVRESGTYSAARILQIFGAGRHSAAVTSAEARRLAGDGPALFERVYGLGNPRKARELGNTQPGDGWLYRGNGLMQTTGRGAHHRLGEICDLADLFETRPEAVSEPKYALLPALAEWQLGRCNALADRNDIRAITRKINGGYNGFADRVAWFNRIYALLREQPIASWEAAKADPQTRRLQQDLSTLGFPLKIDGRYGRATTRAVAEFQRRNGLAVDGIAGPVTLSSLKARLSIANSGGAPAADLRQSQVRVPAEAVIGLGGVGLGELARNAVAALQPFADLSEAVRWLALGLTVAGGAVIAYGLARQALAPVLLRSQLPVAA